MTNQKLPFSEKDLPILLMKADQEDWVQFLIVRSFNTGHTIGLAKGILGTLACAILGIMLSKCLWT